MSLPPPSPPISPPGWFPDPDRTGVLRYWNGSGWSDQRVEPARSAPSPKPPLVTLPLIAAVFAVIATAVTLTGSKILVNALAAQRWPIAAYAAIAAVTGYGPLLLGSWYVCRRWGTGDWRVDLGFRFRREDLRWAPLVWAGAFGAQIAGGIIVLVTKVPFESNTKALADRVGDRSVIIAYAVLAVVCAPIIEELVFRGVVLRGLASRLPIWLAIALQGVLFGCAHIAPERGLKNIGLVIILGGVGVALGWAAYIFRRLAPSMLAHALINGIALTILVVLDARSVSGR